MLEFLILIINKTNRKWPKSPTHHQMLELLEHNGPLEALNGGLPPRELEVLVHHKLEGEALPAVGVGEVHHRDDLMNKLFCTYL